MAVSTITGRGAVLAANLDDTAVLGVDDKNGATRKATVAQLRTQLNTGAQAYAAGVAGAAAAMVSFISKQVTAIANAVATAVLTVTVPNAPHGAVLRVTLLGTLGAGGAIGADEASASISYDIAIARTAGVATVAVISSAFGSAAANVAGAATITITAALSAIAGAVGATQTFTVNVTITRGSGASTNHVCTVLAEILNKNATGVTLS